MATALRSRGLSFREMLMQHDQFTHTQIPMSDQLLIKMQHQDRIANHPYSERSKASGSSHHENCDFMPGDLVFLLSDRSKTHGRERYLVTSVEGDHCFVKKFSSPQLRNVSYKVKKSGCELLPMFYRHNQDTQGHSDGIDGSSPDESENVPIAPCMMNTHDLPVVSPTPIVSPSSMKPTAQPDNKEVDITQDNIVPHYKKDNTGCCPSKPVRNRKHPSWFQDYTV